MRCKGNHFDYNRQTFSQFFQLIAKKIGQPRQTTRNFGGMIADNHKKNVEIILQKHGFYMVVFMLLLCNLYGIVSVVVLLMTFLLLAKVLGC